MDDHLHWDSPRDFPVTGPDVGSVEGAAHPGMDGFSSYLGEEEPLFNLDGLSHSELYNSAPCEPQQEQGLPSWMPSDHLSDPASSGLLDSNFIFPPPGNIHDNPGPGAAAFNPPGQERPLTDVSQWLDGAFSPPVPCSYCRRHRLQCLILRTTAANPNPVTSCSSCVALFRECSLALGEKRQPSRFETLSPVLGNLHGLREICEDAPAGSTVGDARPVSPDLGEGSIRNPESKQFVRKGARVLRSWFLQHQTNPYPTDEQKSQLVLETGFSRQRISTWFANARRRQKQKQQQQGRNPASARVFRAGSPMPMPSSSSWASMTPLERWQASPPEDDPVPESTIRDAIASTNPGPVLYSEPQTLSSSQDDSFFPTFDMDLGGTALDAFLNLEDECSSHRDSSISGLGSRRSDADVSSDSVSSAWSLQSDGGVALPVPSHLRRRSSSSQPLRRRSSRRSRSSNTTHDEGAAFNYTYQCTFCPQSFKKKNDWSRHESSVHLALESWVCTPDLEGLWPLPEHAPSEDHQPLSPTYPNPSTDAECPFCTLPSPSQAHYTSHDFHTCAAKPLPERSFPRKDHLVQHLRKYHSCSKPPVPDLRAWRVPISRAGDQTQSQVPRQGHGQVRSRCGFCGLVMTSWSERADHLAGHFRQGCRMAEWTGDWGFEDEVLAGLRRAVEPGMR